MRENYFLLFFLLFELTYSSTLVATNGSSIFPFGYINSTSKIISAAFQTTDLELLTVLCDQYGPRYRGTPNLDLALEFIVEKLSAQPLVKVQKMTVDNITNWIRGEESLLMISPWKKKMSILGIGNSVGTPSAGITSQVLVVLNATDLKARCSEAKGKIVLFNAEFISYGVTVDYRVNGAYYAASCGALAALVRSVTPFSLNTPHTGAMHSYAQGVPQIPAACVTIEDAELLWRLQQRGHNATLSLYMEAHLGPPVTSYNIIADIVGSVYPEQYVVMGGHTDSWDVGQGAMDDGGGLYSTWQALNVLSSLISSSVIPQPKRTVRLVLWVDEEIGQRGAQVYADAYKSTIENHILAVETDIGNFEPIGFGFTGSDEATEIMNLIGLVLLSPIGAGNITAGGADTDNGFLVSLGVPGGSLDSVGMHDYYFYFHHSNADMINVLNLNGIKASVAALAVLSYVVADMNTTLPR